MKKQKLGLSKLALTKSRIAELNTLSAKGGGESTAPNCILTGIYDGCEITENCNTNGCGTVGCGSNNGCGPTVTQQIITCYEAC